MRNLIPFTQIFLQLDIWHNFKWFKFFFRQTSHLVSKSGHQCISFLACALRSLCVRLLSSLWLLTSLMAVVGHLVTQSPQPMHNSWLMVNEPSTISLAPNCHRSAHIPQPVHLDMSVADIVSDVNNCARASMVFVQSSAKAWKILLEFSSHKYYLQNSNNLVK